MLSTRRAFLGLCVATGTAGCAGSGPPTDPDRPVYITNNAREDVTVDIVVWNDETGETYLEGTTEVSPGSTTSRTVHLDETAEYGIEATLEGGASDQSVSEVNPGAGAAFRVDVESVSTVDVVIDYLD